MDSRNKSDEVKKIAKAQGFELVGVAAFRAEDLSHTSALSTAVSRYTQWVNAGNGASMQYLQRHAALKANPNLLLPGTRSIVCVGLSYGTAEPSGSDAGVSLYARGKDYHVVLGEKLHELCTQVTAMFGGSQRAFVDTQPVMERYWGWQAGLGWIGKNSMLIHRQQGSYFFLGGFLTTLELHSDEPYTEHCGRCTKCIDACPTNAILPSREVNSNLCIAYHTIENKGDVPGDLTKKFGNWIAGCDICQNVCPWNEPIIESPHFKNENPIFKSTLHELSQWDESTFKSRVKGFALDRLKYAMFRRNVNIVTSRG